MLRPDLQAQGDVSNVTRALKRQRCLNRLRLWSEPLLFPSAGDAATWSPSTRETHQTDANQTGAGQLLDTNIQAENRRAIESMNQSVFRGSKWQLRCSLQTRLNQKLQEAARGTFERDADPLHRCITGQGPVNEYPIMPCFCLFSPFPEKSKATNKDYCFARVCQPEALMVLHISSSLSPLAGLCFGVKASLFVSRAPGEASAASHGAAWVPPESRLLLVTPTASLPPVTDEPRLTCVSLLCDAHAYRGRYGCFLACLVQKQRVCSLAACTVLCHKLCLLMKNA